ncbi:50S ribosomal protein L25 [Candidatus Laterigemmans baculatus]|uniref:50S ribosomal protein L25 n=1 Tax=Candidatus Laterigemmans baculatus TaxID=2770505 RepID=UPI0013D990E4|nr:50S ribosomal protein L25 [Candidatus Laterigemmans baculatus]
MTDVLHVELREQIGTAATRRLRKAGKVPGVLYGHGEQNLHFSATSSEVAALVRHHGKTVQLSGAANEHALVNEMQWDPLGIDVLHLDLIRVNLKEMVEVTVPVRLHGEPQGVREGGILLENLHEVDVRCSAGAIPEDLGLAVGGLKLGESLTAAELELPEGVELVTDPETVIAHIEAPRAAREEGAAEGGEPEVIGRSEEEQE